MTLSHRSYRGKIAYIHEDEGELGREWFHVTVDGDHQRTLRCTVEMDPEDLVRDVVLTVNGKLCPIESYVRLNQGGRFKGAAWFRFLDDRAECEGFTVEDGRFSQEVTLDAPIRAFGTHALMTDGWQAALFDHARSDNPQTVADVLTTSPEPDGSSGPRIERCVHVIEYAGSEQLKVAAGAFQTEHYLVHLNRNDWPPLELWVTAKDSQLVRLSWPITKSRYDLVEAAGDFA